MSLVHCRVAKVVAPKKQALKIAEDEYTELMTGLNAKKAELAEVEARLETLNAKLAEMQVSECIVGHQGTVVLGAMLWQLNL